MEKERGEELREKAKVEIEELNNLNMGLNKEMERRGERGISTRFYEDYLFIII